MLSGPHAVIGGAVGNPIRDGDLQTIAGSTGVPGSRSTICTLSAGAEAPGAHVDVNVTCGSTEVRSTSGPRMTTVLWTPSANDDGEIVAIGARGGGSTIGTKTRFERA